MHEVGLADRESVRDGPTRAMQECDCLAIDLDVTLAHARDRPQDCAAKHAYDSPRAVTRQATGATATHSRAGDGSPNRQAELPHSLGDVRRHWPRQLELQSSQPAPHAVNLPRSGLLAIKAPETSTR